MPEVSRLSPSLKTPPAYIDTLDRNTDPTIVLALYTAEAERINRWINVGFNGLVSAMDEKIGQIDSYSETITKWDADCKTIISKQDEDVTKAAKPKRFGIF